MIAPLVVAAVLAVSPPRRVDLGPGALYTQADPGAALVGLQLVVSAGTARQAAGQGGLAALTAELLLATPVGGVPLAVRVAADGGAIAYALGHDDIRFTLEAPPGALATVAGDVAAALAALDASPQTLAAARTALDLKRNDDARNPLAVGLAMLHGSVYGGGAAGVPWGTAATVAGFGPADVTAFVAAHYRRGNAFAVATGAVSNATDAAARAVMSALPAGSEAPPAIAAAEISEVPKRIVARRDVSVPVLLVGFAAPSLGEADFATMLIVRSIVLGIAQRAGTTTPQAFERGVDVVYEYDAKPATFAIAINGGRVDPDLGLSAVDALLQQVSERPIDDAALTGLKASARGAWALEAITLADRASQIGLAVRAGADPGAGRAVLDAIDAVTAADLQRVAGERFRRRLIAVVLPRER